MRNKMGNKSGFTLLEILVVIIIVGVLASVAMPTLFKNVETARSSEALNTLGVMKRQMDGCAMQFNSDYATCGTFANIGMTDPSFTTNPGSHFNYTFPAVGAGSFTIRATRVALDNGNVGDSITMALAGGVIARSGNGAFQNIK
jgi:prepilin-type N-terminal cleavage/methylation domain-containing protein